MPTRRGSAPINSGRSRERQRLCAGRHTSRVKARWNGTTVAESAETIEVGGYHYFPRPAVRMEMLSATTRTPHDLECPHGVQFFDLVDGAERGERLAWTYEAPLERMQQVDHWIGFWRDVSLEP